VKDVDEPLQRVRMPMRSRIPGLWCSCASCSYPPTREQEENEQELEIGESLPVELARLPASLVKIGGV